VKPVLHLWLHWEGGCNMLLLTALNAVSFETVFVLPSNTLATFVTKKSTVHSLVRKLANFIVQLLVTTIVC